MIKWLVYGLVGWLVAGRVDGLSASESVIGCWVGVLVSWWAVLWLYVCTVHWSFCKMMTRDQKKQILS